MSKIKLLFISLAILASTCIKAGEFQLPQLAGSFRLGVASGENSLWASNLKRCSVKESKGKFTCTLAGPLLERGSITIRAAVLSDTNGIIIEVEGHNLPEALQLIWSFGGCHPDVLGNLINGKLEPSHCKYNVFSVEGTAFTVYYGESMRLRTVRGLTPPHADIRLSDAHQQQSPLILFESGKRTDAPVLAASVPVKNGEKLYFCFFNQNRKADYNYFMLPELFEKTF